MLEHLSAGTNTIISNCINLKNVQRYEEKSFLESFCFKSFLLKHLFRIQCIPIWVLFLGLFVVQTEISYAQSLKLSFNEKEIPLGQIINAIEKQSNFYSCIQKILMYTRNIK